MIKHQAHTNAAAVLMRNSAFAIGLLVSAGAQAADALTWKFSGFGTLGIAHSSDRTADFTSSVLHANGAGYSERWSPDVDSRLGGQIDVSHGRWSGVLQLVSEQNLEGSYRPRVEWANIKYQVTPDLAVRLGRIALPLFLAADYRKVGFTLPWVRTQAEVYGSVPISSSDGIDATWQWTAGSVLNSTQVFYGRADVRLFEEKRLRANGVAGLSHSIEQGPLSLRLSALRAGLHIDIGQELFTPLRAFGSLGAALADRYAIDGKRVTMASVGVNYDPGPWFVSGELSRTQTRTLLGRTSSMYVGGGVRFDSLTPYVGYAKIRADSATSDPGLPLPALTPSMRPTAAFLNAGLNAYLSTIPVQSTSTAGIRWDMADSVALKVQYDRVRPTDGSRGTLINQQATFRSGQTSHVASVALDFVF